MLNIHDQSLVKESFAQRTAGATYEKDASYFSKDIAALPVAFAGMTMTGVAVGAVGTSFLPVVDEGIILVVGLGVTALASLPLVAEKLTYDPETKHGVISSGLAAASRSMQDLKNKALTASRTGITAYVSGLEPEQAEELMPGSVTGVRPDLTEKGKVFELPPFSGEPKQDARESVFKFPEFSGRPDQLKGFSLGQPVSAKSFIFRSQAEDTSIVLAAVPESGRTAWIKEALGPTEVRDVTANFDLTAEQIVRNRTWPNLSAPLSEASRTKVDSQAIIDTFVNQMHILMPKEGNYNTFLSGWGVHLDFPLKDGKSHYAFGVTAEEGMAELEHTHLGSRDVTIVVASGGSATLVIGPEDIPTANRSEHQRGAVIEFGPGVYEVNLPPKRLHAFIANERALFLSVHPNDRYEADYYGITVEGNKNLLSELTRPLEHLDPSKILFGKFTPKEAEDASIHNSEKK